MKAFWDHRYESEEWAYGKEPNVFFREQLDKLTPGKILLPGEGEGRNGVYAAMKGWDVDAFDQSSAGKVKAEKLANEANVQIRYKVGEFKDQKYAYESFDCIALIYFHLADSDREVYLEQIKNWLKPGGTIILEGFSKRHAARREKDPKAGGPGDPERLYSLDIINENFAAYEAIVLEDMDTELNEGLYHQGMSSVVRFVGRKPIEKYSLLP